PPAIAEKRPDVPPGVGAVLQQMLAKRADDRVQTPGELAAALAAVTAGSNFSSWTPPTSLRKSAPDPVSQTSRELPRQAGGKKPVFLGSAAALLIGSTIAFLVLRIDRRGGEPSQRERLEPIAGSPKATEPDPKLALTYSNSGLARLNKGDLDGAIADCT